METSLTAPYKTYLAPRIFSALFASLVGLLYAHEWILLDPKTLAIDS
jgi:hypothetical protein